MKRFRKALVLVALIVGPTVATTPPATAQPQCSIADFYSDGVHRAWVSFCHYGEHFTAWDRAPDGMSAAINWKVGNQSGSYTLWATGYNNQTGFNADYPEGTPIKFRACVGHANQSGFLGCSSWVGATA